MLGIGAGTGSFWGGGRGGGSKGAHCFGTPHDEGFGAGGGGTPPPYDEGFGAGGVRPPTTTTKDLELGGILDQDVIHYDTWLRMHSQYAFARFSASVST